MRKLMLAIAAVLLLGAACGDDDSLSLSDAADLGDDPSGGSGDDGGDSGGDSGGDDSGDDSGGDDVGEGADTEFCQFINNIDEDTQDVGDNIDSLSPSDLEDSYDQIEDLIDQAAGLAPGPIEADVDFMATTFKGFKDLLAENDYDVFAAFADPELQNDPRFVAFDSGEFEAASDRVDAFCGIESEPTTDGLGDGSDVEIPEELPEIGGDEMRDIVIQSLQAAYGWDDDLAACVVDELGLEDPTSIDPSVFGDPNAEVCGQSVLELFGAG